MTKHRRKGEQRGALGTIFYSFGSAQCYSRCTCEFIRQHHFPKNSCYLSDFLIRVDSWIHCTSSGRGTLIPTYKSLKRPRHGLPDVAGCKNTCQCSDFQNSVTILNTISSISVFMPVATLCYLVWYLFKCTWLYACFYLFLAQVKENMLGLISRVIKRVHKNSM